MSLFTGSYTNPLDTSAHTAMQAALDATQQTLSAAGAPNADNLAVIVVALTGYEGSPNHPWAALREQEEHYSASLLKVSAMYAAFDLRSSADQLATGSGLTSWPQIEAALKSTFDPDIDAHTPSLISGATSLGSQDKTRKPTYSAMLQPGSGPFAVDFTAPQNAAFEDMMVQQNDPGATTTIHALGYPYLAGKIQDDGFFDGVSDGVWLAGDYAQVWPPVRISCVNDVDTAQGTTAWQLASLLTILADDNLVGTTSSQDMKGLMARAGKWFHEGPTPVWPPNGRFLATHGKVGLGPLKTPGKSVFSEGLIVRDTLRALDFVVVWQNVIQTAGQPKSQLFPPVATLIEAAISAF